MDELSDKELGISSKDWDPNEGTGLGDYTPSSPPLKEPNLPSGRDAKEERKRRAAQQNLANKYLGEPADSPQLSQAEIKAQNDIAAQKVQRNIERRKNLTRK